MGALNVVPVISIFVTNSPVRLFNTSINNHAHLFMPICSCPFIVFTLSVNTGMGKSEAEKSG